MVGERLKYHLLPLAPKCFNFLQEPHRVFMSCQKAWINQLAFIAGNLPSALYLRIQSNLPSSEVGIESHLEMTSYQLSLHLRTEPGQIIILTCALLLG